MHAHAPAALASRIKMCVAPSAPPVPRLLCPSSWSTSADGDAKLSPGMYCIGPYRPELHAEAHSAWLVQMSLSQYPRAMGMPSRQSPPPRLCALDPWTQRTCCWAPTECPPPAPSRRCRHATQIPQTCLCPLVLDTHIPQDLPHHSGCHACQICW